MTSISLALRITQDFLNLSNSLSYKAIEYMVSTFEKWTQLKRQNKKFWTCLKCGLKFNLAITEKKEICTVCRIRNCLN
jgi:hypothetical protein